MLKASRDTHGFEAEDQHSADINNEATFDQSERGLKDLMSDV
jgi:hypothetical protein